nr:PaaI family thioesterase [Oceanococcus sp. HetDA_MAG_MS8]
MLDSQLEPTQGVPYAQLLGIVYNRQEGCYCLPFRPDLVGNAKLPALHGGVVAGFAETAAVLWLMRSESVQGVPKPVDFSIDYLRSAGAQQSFARCEVLKQGRRVAQVVVRVWQQDPNALVAVARMHCLLPAPAQSAEGGAT